MLHLFYLVGTMAYTSTTHSWSAPLLFRLFASLFLRPPWNVGATERLAPDNQLQRGWKTQFISALFLGKQPLEQEMTVDVLIFKRWAPRSLRLDGRSRSNVTELPAPSEQPAQNNSWETFSLPESRKIIQNKCIFTKKCIQILCWHALYWQTLLTYWHTRLWGGNCVFRDLEKMIKKITYVKGTFVCQILTEINLLYAPMPRTCILIENNQINPPLQSDILRWALYLQGWKELPTFESESAA